jgi:hypothetical protein
MGGCMRYGGLFTGDTVIFIPQLFFGFLVIRVFGYTIDRADLDTLRSFIVTYTFGAQVRINDIDFITWRNRSIGAFRFTDITIDTFIGDYQGHG